MMRLLGYVTDVETDIASNVSSSTLSVYAEVVVNPPLRPIYWQVFDELNEHNLIS